MPTYDYKCPVCQREESVMQSIRSYCASPIRPKCHGEMERKLSVVPGTASSNALAGDRHYDGLRASDGADISSRTKHRNYMNSKGLALASDFTQTWTQAYKERLKLRKGETLPERKRDVAEVVERAIQN